MIDKSFQRVLDAYQSDKLKFKIDNTRPRSIKSLETAELIVNQIPNLLQNESNAPKEKYKFEGSVGKGNISEVPWICVFDRSITESAENGYYIVYLFNSSMTGLYISLNQGWTQYKNIFGSKTGIQKIRETALKAKKILHGIEGFYFGEILLNPSRTLVDGYEQGNIISKYYPSNSIPNDIELIDDLRNLIGIYRELKGYVGLNILNIKDVVSEEEFQSEIQVGTISELHPGKIPLKLKSQRGSYEVWSRDRNMSYTSLQNANFKCENNPEHETFPSNLRGHPFMEAHHLIPMEFQSEFENSIDVPENIICLCPTCHRAFHNSVTELRTDLINKFFSLRRNKLEERGINISNDKLIYLYTE